MKKLICLLLLLCMLFSLTACGGSELKDVTLLVKGNIDVIYLGKYDPAYLKLVDSNERIAEQEYLSGLEVEAEYFAHYWGIVDSNYDESFEDLDESFRQEIIELYREIYSHSKYEVQEAIKQDESSYAVKVLIDPIDVMDQAVTLYENDEYEPLNDFWVKYADADFSLMSDEEYLNYTHEYGRIIVQLVRDQLPNLGYMEQKSQTLQVQETDGVQTINSDDWAIFDSYVIYYP